MRYLYRSTVRSSRIAIVASLAILGLATAGCGNKPKPKDSPGPRGEQSSSQSQGPGGQGTQNTNPPSGGGSNEGYAPGEVTKTNPSTGVVTRKNCQEASDCGVEGAICKEDKCYSKKEELCSKLQCGELERCEQGTGSLSNVVYCVPNCNVSDQCGGVCRSSSETDAVCVDFQWKEPCSGGAAYCPTEGGSQCCEDGTVCLGNACVPYTSDCNPDEERYCKTVEFCDATTLKCINYERAVCTYEPPTIKDIAVTLKFPNRWPRVVYTTPLVANLDETDTPEIVFLQYMGALGALTPASVPSAISTWDATLRAIKGSPSDPSDITSVVNFWQKNKGESGLRYGKDGAFLYSDVVPAVAKLNNSQAPSVVALVNSPKTPGINYGFSVPQKAIAAFNGVDGSLVWQTPLPQDSYVTEAGGISIGDIDQDGEAEIVAVGQIYNSRGEHLLTLPMDKKRLGRTTKWNGGSRSPRIQQDRNYNLVSDVPILADMNNDGCLDIIDGRLVFLCERVPGGNPPFRMVPTIPVEEAGRPYNRHGAVSAIADFDKDGTPEIVTSSHDTIYLSDNLGNLITEIKAPNPGNFFTKHQWSGENSPTIADFDGDEKPEIGIAFDAGYAVYDVEKNDSGNPKFNIALRWFFEANKASNEVTGSSVFDFNADGKVEIVFVDDSNVYILADDPDHLVAPSSAPLLGEKKRLKKAVTSLANPNIGIWGASLEPVVADVTNDGHANIILSGLEGIKVLSSKGKNWVPTRPIWNQHAYSVTNINSDVTVPNPQKKNWELEWLNNFRQNVQEGNPLLAPDFVVKAKPSFTNGCEVTGNQSLIVHYEVQNVGSAPAKKGQLKTKVYVVQGGSEHPVAEVTNKGSIAPNETESYTLDLPITGTPLASAPFDLKFVVDTDNAYNECREDNNTTIIRDIGAQGADATVSVDASQGVLSCLSDKRVPITVTVNNQGNAAIAANTLSVGIYEHVSGGEPKKLTELPVTEVVPVGGSVTLSYTWENFDTSYINRVVTIEAVVDEENTLKECNEENNKASTVTVCQQLG